MDFNNILFKKENLEVQEVLARAKDSLDSFEYTFILGLVFLSKLNDQEKSKMITNFVEYLVQADSEQAPRCSSYDRSRGDIWVIRSFVIYTVRDWRWSSSMDHGFDWKLSNKNFNCQSSILIFLLLRRCGFDWLVHLHAHNDGIYDQSEYGHITLIMDGQETAWNSKNGLYWIKQQGDLEGYDCADIGACEYEAVHEALLSICVTSQEDGAKRGPAYELKVEFLFENFKDYHFVWFPYHRLRRKKGAALGERVEDAFKQKFGFAIPKF